MGLLESLIGAAPYVAPVLADKRLRDRQQIDDETKRAFAQQAQERQARQDALAGRIGESTIGLNEARRLTALEPKITPPDPREVYAANRRFAIDNPLPPVAGASEPMEVTVGPKGERVYTQRSKAAGMQAPAPEPRAPVRDPVADHMAIRDYDNAHQAPKSQQSRALPSSAVEKLSGLDAMQIMAQNVQKGLEDAIASRTDATGRAGGLIKEPGWIMNLRGKGGDAGRDVRTDIGNLYGTVAKERGGTALSAAELSLLESYIPNKDEDEAVALSKAKKFIETLQKIKAAKIAAYSKYGYGQDDEAPLGDHLEGSAPPGNGKPKATAGKTITVNGKTFKVPD